ncbi:hypothetical protein CEE37_09740 [candidate division LCP-89 bacterium B3_LCP]|uniref:Sulfatase N-terminal domain-containing protein n=1 Tax=candidate division LCP-89 bacterium B3_LCP TaxID=2012998 RepID=A0A532UYL8_UNCL8|nr:MAG: hypothetical protein CEE37_09740 [candidate division LCP-89 bacterium B3_LCP]
MADSQYTFSKHIGASLIAGLLFSLAVGFIFNLKMIGINEGLHTFRYAYPFTLNFIPMYLILGLIFGLVLGVIGGIIIRSGSVNRKLGIMASYGISALTFLLVYLIIGEPVGVAAGMFLATLVFIAVHGLRPPLARLYFAVFFTSVLFNYSWQWVRQHFIVNPLLPLSNSNTMDIVFTIFWGLLILAAFRIFMKAFFKLPVKVFYSIGVVFLIVLTVVGGAYYLLAPQPGQAETVTDLQIERRSTDVKVVLIGIDGMWWKIIDPLLEQDRLPNLQNLIESGTSGFLETLFPTFSAAIWTSMTTGKSPEKHGVTAFLVWKFPWSGFTVPCFVTPKITAEMNWMRSDLVIEAPITNQFLDATPIWLMLSDQNVKVGTVNWWVSWPAHEVNGFVVTDHCLYNKSYIMQNYRDREGITAGDIYPFELLEELIQFAHGPEDVTESEIRRFLNVEDSTFIDEFKAIDTYDYLDIAYEASMLKYSYPEDVTFASAARYLIQTRQPEYFSVYLKGTDSMEHQYLKYYFEELHSDKLIPENVERYRDLIDNYYVYIDEVIGSLMEVADPNTIFMVVSDHGFDEIMLPTGHYNHMASPAGVFIAAGPGIHQNTKVNDAHVYDITPTILHVLGMPVADDFDGRVLEEIFTEDIPVSNIPTYETGRRASRRLIESDIDDNYKERLRALGYTN